MQIHYHKVNNCCGFLMFLIAASVYCFTVEPTASFWDCSEFIISAHKLEVGHSPGAPFFMLTANLFTQFTNDPSNVAAMVNYMSALTSAATIMFLFWSITHLTRRLLKEKEHIITLSQTIVIMGSGVVGALVYTFSDTFWFSAVEGEVYAYSSLFTALVFWLILKWEEKADEPYSDRWLILISYLIGLSIGVHLLNLLCLPAIVLVYYYRRYPDKSLKKIFFPLTVSILLVIAVLFGIIPGIVKVGGLFELLFVNTLGLPYNSGLYVYILILSGVFIWGIFETYQSKQVAKMNISFLFIVTLLGIPFLGRGITSILIGIFILSMLCICLFNNRIKNKLHITRKGINTSLLCLLLMVIGYSSYALIVIRSTANTPMDQNSPEDIFTLGEYLAREQYGTAPLFYGPTFSSQRSFHVEDGYCVYDRKENGPIYIRKSKENSDEKDEYIIADTRWEPIYAQNMVFPRMYKEEFKEEYHRWVNIKGHDILYDRCGEMITVNIPTQWENLKFFFSYQLNFMYWRYFLWNFVGRQNDLQGQGEIEHGNWITGISFIDNFLIGDQKSYPDELKNNKGRNVFYGFPLLLGVAGIIFQLSNKKKGMQSFSIISLLFFMTGIAIVIYLNQSPLQVRERDYAYAGSFYAFSIWIGMGMAAIYSLFRKMVKAMFASILAFITCILVPIQMAGQTWDDHDRSNRYVCRDFGNNYLMSCQEEGNPILFCNGDNDTFPLWYNVEIEGNRNDIRACNLSYLQTDWYIDQMKRPAYQSPALPISWKRSEYVTGTSEYIFIRPELKTQINAYYKADPTRAAKEFGDNPFELKNILRYWVRSGNEQMRVIPTDSIVIKLDKEAILRSGMTIPDSLNGNIPEFMHLSLKGKQALTKSELMMLEIISGCNWERPVYITTTTGPDSHLCFADYFSQEGLAYRITPFNTTALGTRIDTKKMYDNLMNKFKWGGINNPNIYLDESVLKICYWHRRLFATLSGKLIKEGKPDKALEVLQYCEKVIPASNIPLDYQNGALNMAIAYYTLGQKDKADAIIDQLATKSEQFANWYLSLPEWRFMNVQEKCIYYLGLLDEEIKIMEQYDSSLRIKHSNQLQRLYERLLSRTHQSL